MSKFVPDKAGQEVFRVKVMVEVTKRMELVLVALENKLALNLNRPGKGRIYGSHRASLPGDFPARYTGALINSINHFITPTGKSIVGWIGTDEPHGRFLEFGTRKMAPRPWLLRTVVMSRSLMQRIFRTGGLK